MSKVLKIVLIVIPVIFVLVSVIGGIYMLNVALAPPRDNDMHYDYAKSESQFRENYQFQTSWLDSLQSAGAIKDTTIISQTGERLVAHYIYAPEPTDKTAVLIHGYTDCYWRMMMFAYLYNRELGYNVLLPDHYAHGMSEGDHIRMGWFDRLDCMKWMDVANEIFGGENGTQMVVHGVSMGAATTMMISGEENRPYVKCFVEDCGYTSVWDEFSNELKRSFGLPAFPILYAADLFCKIKYGWSFKEASAIEQVAKSTLPMLFIHGDTDDFVPTEFVYPLYDAKVNGDKEIWLTKGVKHAESYYTYPDEYTHRIKEFVGRYIH